MNKIGLWLAWMVVLWPAGTYGQPGPDAPAAAACSPATTLDELTGTLDDAVSGPRDKDRACLRELMMPGARMTPMRKEQDGGFAPRALTVEDWINAVRGHAGAPFYERQVKVKTETYGHFAHL